MIFFIRDLTDLPTLVPTLVPTGTNVGTKPFFLCKKKTLLFRSYFWTVALHTKSTGTSFFRGYMLGPSRISAAEAWGARDRETDSLRIGHTPRRLNARPSTAPNQANRKKTSRPRPQTAQGRRLRTGPQLLLSSSRRKPVPRPITAPPIAGAWRRRKLLATPFRRAYQRGDIPCNVGHGATRKVHWKVDISTLDYHHYLPIFFEGLREVHEPYCFLAYAGVQDLLKNGNEQILPVVPQLVLPIKAGLDTRDRKIICVILKVLQALVKAAPMVGEALVPYYRQILPIFNCVLVLEKRKNIGDQIEYGQRRRDDLIDLVNETLELLEKHGGEDAFINIKYIIPTWESSV